MAIPNLPTDNLYKFLALSGIVVVFLCFTYRNNRLNELQKKIDENHIEEILLELDLEELKSKSDELSKKIAYIEKALDKLEIDSISKIGTGNTFVEKIEILKDEKTREYLEFVYKYIDYVFPALKEIDENEKNSIKLSELTFLIQKKVKLYENKTLLAARYAEDLRSEKLFSILGILFGLGLSIFGFILWYIRVQAPLDRGAIKIPTKN